MAENRIALLLGAGFSAPFDYPTTKQFFEILLKEELLNINQKKILQAMASLPSIKDIEHVLSLIDTILLDKNNVAVEFLSSVIKKIVVIDLHYEKWSQFQTDLTELKKKIIDQIYDQYHFKPSTGEAAFTNIGELLYLLNTPNKTEVRDIFTLNYDRLFEEFFLNSNNYELIDGFMTVKNRQFWNKTVYQIGQRNPVKPYFNLFKLHGSLNWREWKNGDIECLPTEEPLRNSYYKKNVFIYPTEQCDVSQEPYSTLYGYFNQIRERNNVLIIIGYAFRDDPINRVIEDFLLSSKNNSVIAISPSITEDLARLSNRVVTHPKFQKIIGKFPDEKIFIGIKEKLVG